VRVQPCSAVVASSANPLQVLTAVHPCEGDCAVQGTNENYETTVDSHGHFTVSGLPPGHYTVLLNAEGELHTSPPVDSATVNVADKGCAEFNFWIDPFAKKQSVIPHDGDNLQTKLPDTEKDRQ
jgi:hypothetical protein